MAEVKRDNPMAEHDLPPPKHEERDVSLARIALVGAGLLVIVLIAHGVTGWQFAASRKAHSAAVSTSNVIGRTISPSALPSEPRLEGVQKLERASRIAETAYEPRDLHQLQLQAYGWVDRSKGIVRIPIADAMRMVIEQQHERQKESSR
jgi:small-conductance mechanosensitive channel